MKTYRDIGPCSGINLFSPNDSGIDLSQPLDDLRNKLNGELEEEVDFTFGWVVLGVSGAVAASCAVYTAYNLINMYLSR